MWMDETIGQRINENRTDEALALGPDLVTAACPFCQSADRLLRDKGAQDGCIMAGRIDERAAHEAARSSNTGLPSRVAQLLAFLFDKDPAPLIRLGEHMREKERKEEALTYFARARQLDPHAVEAE